MTIGVVAFFACLVTCVAAQNEADQMMAIGMPTLFIILFIASILLTHKQLITAHEASSLNPALAWIFRASLLSALLSIFLYCSAAWAYGLMQSLVAYFLACVCGGAAMQRFAQPMLLFMLAWFCVLIGVPNGVSVGIFTSINTTSCNLFYGTMKDKMCKEQWLVFVQIIATIQIGITFLQVISLMAAGLASSTGAGDYHSVPDDGNKEYKKPAASGDQYQTLVE